MTKGTYEKEPLKRLLRFRTTALPSPRSLKSLLPVMLKFYLDMAESCFSITKNVKTVRGVERCKHPRFESQSSHHGWTNALFGRQTGNRGYASAILDYQTIYTHTPSSRELYLQTSYRRLRETGTQTKSLPSTVTRPTLEARRLANVRIFPLVTTAIFRPFCTDMAVPTRPRKGVPMLEV